MFLFLAFVLIVYLFCFVRFSNDRKYEEGKFQKYKTLHENVDIVMRKSGNPNALDADGPQVSCLVSPEAPDAEIQFLQQMGVANT